MARATRPTIVYQYGARVVDGLDAYHDEERAMHRQYNALVALRRTEIERVHDALASHVPWVGETEARLAEISAAIEEARASIRRGNSRQQKRAPSPEDRARIRALQAERRALVGTHARDDDACECFRCRRRRAYAEPVVAAALAGIGAETHTERKRMYAERAISWADWNDVVGRVPSTGVPRFRAWRNDGGKVGVQLTGGGARWADLVSGEAAVATLRIEAEPLPTHSPGGPISPTGRRVQRPRYLVRVRVGADSRSRQDHRWITARMSLHRPIPEDAIIQQVHVVRRRIATHDKYSVHFVLSRADGWAKQTGTGTAALNLGWRAVDGGRRVGYVVDDAGRTRELVLPDELVRRQRKVDDLRSIRDRAFDIERETLRAWLSERDVPEWLREATSHLHQWRATARLAGLVLRWRENRFEGDDAAYDRLEAWRRQDRHLYDWEGHQRARVQRQRRELYRRWAAELRYEYGTVLIDDTDYRAILRTPDAEDHDTPERLNTRWYLRLCAPGLLRETLVEAGIGEPVDAAGITRMCSVCGADAASGWDAASEVTYRCASGHALDQDANAAANMLARAAGVVRE